MRYFPVPLGSPEATETAKGNDIHSNGDAPGSPFAAHRLLSPFIPVSLYPCILNLKGGHDEFHIPLSRCTSEHL